ncbi:MAG: hypothetical protein ABFS86_05515 [Planctomycetota bacterium]
MRNVIGWALAVALLAACGGSADEPVVGGGGGSWEARVVFRAPDKIGGLDVGELIASDPGEEIACVLRNGEAHIVLPSGSGSVTIKVADVGGEMLQCAIGDVDARYPGNEIVIAGMKSGTEEDGGPGAVYVLSHVSEHEGAWRCAEAWLAPALVHGVTVMDIDPARPGNEIVCVGFDSAATIVYRDGDGWAHETVVDLPGKGKSVAPLGSQAVIATALGTVGFLTKDDDSWEFESLRVSEAGQSRLGVAPDGRIVSAGDDGALRLIDDGKVTVIHREAQKLRGAVLADLDPASPGLEAATASYLMKITVLTPDGDGWRPEVVFTDTGKFHHLDAGDILPDSPGMELAGCGYSKNLVVVRRTAD